MKIEDGTSAVVDAQAEVAAEALAPGGGARRTFLLRAAGGMATPRGRRFGCCREGIGRGIGRSRISDILLYWMFSPARPARPVQKAISVFRIDQSGGWTLVQTLETGPNPQFIAFDHQQRFLYSVHGDGTEVSSYAIDKTSGWISFLNKQPTNGKNSTHLTPDPSKPLHRHWQRPGRGGIPDQSGRLACALHRHGPGHRAGGPAPQSNRGGPAPALCFIRSQRPVPGCSRSRA